MDKRKLLAAGGDLRMLIAAAGLSDRYDVEITGFCEKKLPDEEREILSRLKDNGGKADILLLPPVVTDNNGRINAAFGEGQLEISEVMDRVKPGGMVLMGIKGGAAEEEAEKRGFWVCNYMQDESLTLANAIPTAEAALKTAMEETGRTIWGSRVLVTGFGRIGTILTDRLIKLGADVTTAARKECDRMKIKAMGGKPADIMPEQTVISETDIIFNTVPAEIFGKEELGGMKKECVFIDLASAPGGVKRDAVKETGCKYVWATGLPGKAAPRTAGLLLADAVMRILEERMT